ncbi:uncharacterized protein LOC131687699 [Topomyia yanbarensis]|uniref:uncharacterized protein LOC131687699 n=1 Tax=Topomyia yanbarensis TaxID=2498891 RepID=UPI00273B2382|nr:uncharacterized protein LOC131687699 [Topomyia yanbarensis]
MQIGGPKLSKTEQDLQRNRVEGNKKRSDSTKTIEFRREKTGLLKIGSLNVRGCKRQEKREEIDDVLRYYDVDIAALQEVNTDGKIIDSRNYKWLIAREGQNKSRGLAVLIKKEANIVVQDIRKVGHSAVSVRLQVEGEMELVLVNVHGPNKKAFNFLSSIGAIVDRNHLGDKLLVVGDWNAQIGKDSVTEEDSRCIGKELGFNNRNDNGEEYNMFLHIHKLINISSMIGVKVRSTWRVRDKESQIDHIVKPVDGKVGIRYIRGIWTRINTDHKLLLAGVRLPKMIKKQSKEKNLVVLDASALKEKQIKKRYHEALKSHEMEIDPEKVGINEAYPAITNKMKKASNITLSSSRVPLTPGRKSALNRLNKALSLANKYPDMLPYKWKERDRKQEFQAAVRNHNETEVREFYMKLNDFDAAVRIRKSYQFMKKFTKRKQARNAYIPTRLWGEILKESEGPRLELLEEQDTCTLTEPPTMDEMSEIVRHSCNGKSAGADGVRMEYIKYADEETMEQMMGIWRRIWIENVMPKDMTESIQIPIPKISRPRNVDNFRRISLCNVGYKPYAKWIRKRLKEFTGELDLYQAAFTEGRSTDDQIFMARRTMEEFWNAGKSLIAVTLDIRKAFDNISLDKLKDVLLKIEVPSHIINRVLNCVREDRTRVRWQNQLSEESVLRKVAELVPNIHMIREGSFKLPCILAFADDLLILAEKKEDLERIIKAIEECLSEVGLDINNNKSQILMRVPNPAGATPDTMMLNGKPYEVSDAIKYLGIHLTRTLDRPATVRHRCVNAVKAAKVVVEFCKKFKPAWEIGRLIYNTVIAPAMLYGTKVSTLTKRSRQQLAKYEKLIVKDIWMNCRKCDNRKLNVRKELNGKTINRRVRVGRLKYYGHIIRRNNKHPLKLAYKMEFEKKKEGRPSYTWKDSLTQDFNKFNEIGGKQWEDLAKDKMKLKQKVEEIYKMEDSEISDGEEEEI